MKAFVIMPFDIELNGVYDEFIRPVTVAVGFDVKRADDLQTSQSILRDIIGSISNADLVIADLTNNNPNVFYELGIAHAFDKPVILLTQDIAEVPFDLLPYRVLHYDTHFSKIQLAREKLTALAELAYKSELKSGNPVSDFSLVAGQQQEPHIKDVNTPIRPDNNQEEAHGELGILDYQTSFEEGLVGAGECTEVFNRALSKVTEATNAALPALATESKLSGREKRDVARRLASQIDLAAQLFTSTNENYSTCVEKIAMGVNGLFSGKFALVDDAAKCFENLFSGLRILGNANTGQLESTRQLISVIDSTPPIESNLNKSTKDLRQQLSMYVQNAELMSAVITHAIDLGSALLEKTGHS